VVDITKLTQARTYLNSPAATHLLSRQ